LMIDTGSEANLIKRSVLDPRISVTSDEKLRLFGITPQAVSTLGATDIPLYGTIVRFHVVPHNFPIPADGILGAHFLEEGAEISYPKNRVLWKGIEIPFTNRTRPQRETNLERKTNSKFTNSKSEQRSRTSNPTRSEPRSNSTNSKSEQSSKTAKSTTPTNSSNSSNSSNDTLYKIKARSIQVIGIKTTGPETGFLPRQELAPGITVFDSVVKNTNGKAYVRAVNSTSDTITFPIPTLTVQEIADLAVAPNKGDSKYVHSIKDNRSHEQREKEIQGIINTDHLNFEEREHVHRIISENNDVFHLPGEQLGKTTIVEHSIPTTDEKPINVKQYRYPPIHKEEINNQMRELLL
ncbi:hypothetical protein WH47_00963, partial [Habropoda laboriosa]